MKKFEKEAYGYIKDMFVQHNMVKRVVLTVLSIVVMGLGIALFSVSGFGVDPFTSMNMNVSSTLGIGYGTYQLIVNAVIIVFVVIVAHRGLIGVGTLINMVGVGYSCELFEKIIEPSVKASRRRSCTSHCFTCGRHCGFVLFLLSVLRLQHRCRSLRQHRFYDKQSDKHSV